MIGGCGVNRMDGESNENVYRKFGTSGIEKERAVEWWRW